MQTESSSLMPDGATSAQTSRHKSARSDRIELIPRGERRRRWTTEQKQTIAAHSLSPGVSPTDVAREHGISTGQLTTWRRALLAAQPALRTGFARVAMTAVSAPPAPRPVPRSPTLPAVPIEIVLPDGTVLRIDPGLDMRALRRVLAALRG
jgi:transposase